MRNKIIVAAIVAAMLLLAAYLFNKYAVAPQVNFEKIQLTDLDGNPVLLHSFQQPKLFINFFATWCGPCMRELPAIKKAQQTLGSTYQFILISDEPIELLRGFNNKTQGEFLVLHSTQSLQRYKIYSIPASYVLNNKQQIIFKQTGEEDWANEATLQMLQKL